MLIFSNFLKVAHFNWKCVFICSNIKIVLKYKQVFFILEKQVVNNDQIDEQETLFAKPCVLSSWIQKFYSLVLFKMYLKKVSQYVEVISITHFF